MTDYYFSKAKLTFAEVIIVFEQGCLGKPVCILDKNAVERLTKEWKRKITIEEEGNGRQKGKQK